MNGSEAEGPFGWDVHGNTAGCQMNKHQITVMAYPVELLHAIQSSGSVFGDTKVSSAQIVHCFGSYAGSQVGRLIYSRSLRQRLPTSLGVSEGT